MYFLLLIILIGILLYSLNRRIKTTFRQPFGGEQSQQKHPKRHSSNAKIDLTTIDKRKFDKGEGEYVSFEEEQKQDE